MKHYMRFLWIAVFCGAFCVYGCTRNFSNIIFSEIILMLGFNEAVYYPYAIADITYWYIPLLLYQIFYGTYIYRHFCSASIYFFSRNCNRTKWFLKEAAVLYLFGLAYIILLVLSGTVITLLLNTIIFDYTSTILVIYYLLIHSLFLFISALGINVFAILFTSNVGFIIVEGIILFATSAFCMTGIFFITEDALLDKYTWLLKINPFAHLVFSVHSSEIGILDDLINPGSINFDLNLSVFIFTVFAAILVGCGCVIVNNHNFVDSNMETGGM